MSREIDADFTLLSDFIENYKINQILQDQDGLSLIKKGHKDYLPFLQLWSICFERTKNDSFLFFKKKIGNNSQELLHLREAISDTGSGLFCCLHGAYKPGYMALRSSIENFLRFSSSPFIKGALTTTSIYELFNLAKKTEPFLGARKTYIDQLRNCYVELCKYTHSTSLEHMAGVHALAHFPSFEGEAFQEWLSIANVCMRCMGVLIILGDPSIYLNSHFSSKELLELLIPKKERLTLLKGGAR